jgi:hypothetical protein
LVQDSFGLVQGCFNLVLFGSRLFQLFTVASSVQGHVGGSRWLCFSSFQVYLFGLKISSVWFKVASTVQVMLVVGFVPLVSFGSKMLHF